MAQSTSSNQEFESKLKAIMGDRPDLRPFICDGLPMECQIFIVGYNPATEMSQSFWTFWHNDTGFNKTAWFEAYKRDRREKPLKPGKTRRTLVSSTRQRIEWIVETAAPIKCLETNLYGTATETAKDLDASAQNLDVFEFLVREIAPQVILLHGSEARRSMECLAGLQLEPDSLTDVSLGSHQAKVIAVCHLSRGWSQIKARALGGQLREVCTLA
jgi:hypothetical protein